MKALLKSILKKKISPYFILKLREWFPSRVKKESDFKEIIRKSLFYSSFIQRGEMCFDVGANIGNRISPLLQIGAKVVAVEPQEKCYHYLKRKYGRKIIIVRKGLGQYETIKKFYLSSDSTISSFADQWIEAVRKTNRFEENTWNKVVKVQMTTADRLVEKYGVPSFIKIDVEGYELEVLKGLTQPIKMISFEYTVPEQPEIAQMCIDQIESNGKDIECNYSIGESMLWALNEWIPTNEMKIHILTDEFKNTCFGDIYVRTKRH